MHDTKKYFLEEIKRSELISKKDKSVCTNLSYIEHFLILDSTIIGCVSISSFASLVGVHIGVTSSKLE